MDIAIRQLLPGDVAEFSQLVGVFAEVFGMNGFRLPDERYLGPLLAGPAFIVFVARAPDGVIGGLTAHVLPSYYVESSEVYVYDLAVRSEFQRKGVGRKLVEALAGYCRTHGFREFFVQADAPDEHALRFYSALGGIPQRVVHYNFQMDK
jgi:aminoglycoside 3-N-acetyltransferase I